LVVGSNGSKCLKINLGIEVNIPNEEWAVYFGKCQSGVPIKLQLWAGVADYLHPMDILPAVCFTTDQFE